MTQMDMDTGPGFVLLLRCILGYEQTLMMPGIYHPLQWCVCTSPLAFFVTFVLKVHKVSGKVAQISVKG